MPFYKEDDSSHTYLSQDTNEGFTYDSTVVFDFFKSNWMLVAVIAMSIILLIFYLATSKKSTMY